MPYTLHYIIDSFYICKIQWYMNKYEYEYVRALKLGTKATQRRGR
jgi:hypothetical protein